MAGSDEPIGMTIRSGYAMAVPAGLVFLAGLVVFCGGAILSLVMTVRSEQAPWSLLADPYLWNIAGFTLTQAFLSTLLSMLGGIPVAIALHRRAHFAGRGLIIRLMQVPMRMPTLVIAFALIGIWGQNGFLNQMLTGLGLGGIGSIYGLTGILIAHTFFNIPLVAQLLLQGFEQVPAEYWRMAAGLNMGPVPTFRLIEWPVIRRRLPALSSLIFILCVTSFTLVLVLGGGPGATTLEVAIYQSLHFDFDPVRAVMFSVVQIMLTGLVLLLFRQFSIPLEPGFTLSSRMRRYDGEGIVARTADAACIAVFTLYVLLPLARIVSSGVAADFLPLIRTSLFWQALATSAFLSVVAGILALTFSAIILVARHAISLDPSASRSLRSASIGLAAAPSALLLIPPVVLATGWFLALPNPAETRLSGPVLVLLLNALMALPFALRLLEPVYQVHVRRTDILCASLALSGWMRFRLVDWPCLRAAALRAFSFAMALSLGDLGAVALFGSNGFVTLPWLLYSKLGSYRSSDADALALLIAVICFALASLGYRTSRQEADQ
jgi:thiamine transport system permease protein